MKKLYTILSQKIKQDKADYIQSRIWKLEDRYNILTMSPGVKEKYRRLKKELKELLKD